MFTVSAGTRPSKAPAADRLRAMPPTRVALFVTCLADLLHPEVGEAAVALLREAGVDVAFPAAQTCCGQPPFNAGFQDDARRMGSSLLDAFENFQAVVAPSGSCAAMLRSHYPDLFRGTRDAARADDLAAKTYELSAFLVDELGMESFGGAFQARVTYHDSCHGLRELGLGGQGRKLLSGIAGLELAEMTRPDSCCGFGGTFSVKMPELSTVMADDKLAQAVVTEAEYLVGGDLGCLVHLAGRLSRKGSPIRTIHLAVLLARAAGLAR